MAGPVSPGVKFEQRQLPGAAVARGNALDVKLTNVKGATFGLERMGLTLRKALKVHVDTGVATELTLRGFYTKVSVVGLSSGFFGRLRNDSYSHASSGPRSAFSYRARSAPPRAVLPLPPRPPRAPIR